MWFEWIKFESALFLGLFCETHFVFEGCYLRTIQKEDCKTAALHHLCWWTEKDSRHTAHTDWEQKTRNKQLLAFSFKLNSTKLDTFTLMLSAVLNCVMLVLQLQYMQNDWFVQTVSVQMIIARFCVCHQYVHIIQISQIGSYFWVSHSKSVVLPWFRKEARLWAEKITKRLHFKVGLCQSLQPYLNLTHFLYITQTD